MSTKPPGAGTGTPAQGNLEGVHPLQNVSSAYSAGNFGNLSLDGPGDRCSHCKCFEMSFTALWIWVAHLVIGAHIFFFPTGYKAPDKPAVQVSRN